MLYTYATNTASKAYNSMCTGYTKAGWLALTQKQRIEVIGIMAEHLSCDFIDIIVEFINE